MNRKPWDDYFLDVAEVVSHRSTCPRASVGVVLVRDRHILATGYNGAAPGEPHCTEVGCDVEHDHCTRAIHAEQNAIGQAARRGVNIAGATVYISTTKHTGPCPTCSKLLQAADVVKIVTRAPGPGTPLLEALDAFKANMLAKFYAVAHKHGETSVTVAGDTYLHGEGAYGKLWDHFDSEVREFWDAEDGTAEEQGEAVDVANMAFLIWWRNRGVLNGR